MIFNARRAPAVDRSRTLIATTFGLGTILGKWYLILLAGWTVILLIGWAKWWLLVIIPALILLLWLLWLPVRIHDRRTGRRAAQIARDKHFAKYGKEPEPWK